MTQLLIISKRLMGGSAGLAVRPLPKSPGKHLRELRPGS